MDTPNIVLIVLDTVRARNLSCYGYDRETTPFLESLATESICYPQAFAPAPWTVPSHASLFTGTYVAEHQTDRSVRSLNPDLPTLAGELSDEGYTTVGISNNLFVSPEFGFDRGFDRFETIMDAYHEPFSGGMPISQLRRATTEFDGPRKFVEALKRVRENDDRLAPTVANWVYRKAEEEGFITDYDRGARSTNNRLASVIPATEEPFFLFVNYMEGHAPYRAPDEYQHRYVSEPTQSDWGRKEPYFENRTTRQRATVRDLQDQYDGCIRYLDERIREMYELLDESGKLENTLFVVTSDHGEAFGEHGLYEHESGVYNELSRVPLLVGGGARPELDDVHKPVSLRWIFPTVLELVDGSVPTRVENVNLFSPSSPVIVESEPLPFSLDPNYDCSVQPDKYADDIVGLIGMNHKYIRFSGNSSNELYRSDDLMETRDLANEETDLVSELSGLLDEMFASVDTSPRPGESPDIAMDVQEHLADLGYRPD